LTFGRFSIALFLPVDKNQGIRILTSPQVEGLPAANKTWAQSQEMAMQTGLLTSPKRQYQHE